MARAGSRTTRILLALAVLLGLGAGASLMALWWGLLRDLPDFETLADYRPELTSTVVDRQGRPIGEFFEYRRRLTPLEEVPEVVVRAFLAAEDDSFYEHSGVDYVSIARAAWANLRAGGETRQGASTITQQMVKQLLLSPERTYRRKIRELILASRIEQRFSKDEILFLYLNQIYFGSGAYGVGEAAWTYFGKPISEIDTGEAALLAGLPKAPSSNSPYLNPERGEQRRRYVLGRMREEGFIDEATWRAASENPPALLLPAERAVFPQASYFVEEVRKSLVERLGNEMVLRGGLRIETTLDLDLQGAAVRAVRAGLEALDRRRGYRGPLATVAPDAIAAERERLAEANGLTGSAAEEGLPTEEPLTGVVISLDLEAQAARVAFGRTHEARVLLEDVAWARPAGSDDRSPIQSIDAALSPGDVALFRVGATGNDDEQGEPRAALHQEPLVQGALLSFEVGSGDVLTLVGGYDFEGSEFNRATQAQRQPGSAFKPLIYAAALGRGLTPASIVYDRPVVYEDAESGFVWRPENYGRQFYGAVTLSEALARSINNATIHLLRDVGMDHALSLATRLGIESPLERNLGLALGVNPVTLLEITRAYAVFAAGGRAVRPRFVERVLDRDGNVLLEDLALAPPPEGWPDPGHREKAEAAAGPPALEVPALPEPGETPARSGRDDPWADLPPGQVIPPSQAYLAASLLRGVVEHPRGTGRRARSLRRSVGGKTGTTNDQGDAWFVGFSPDVATGVWVGFDERRVLGRGETGGRAALPIWIEFMAAALPRWPARDFDVPDGIVFARVEPDSGLLASAGSETSVFMPFLKGSEPREHAEEALSSAENRRLRLDF